jgi:hypothetical protein
MAAMAARCWRSLARAWPRRPRPTLTSKQAIKKPRRPNESQLRLGRAGAAGRDNGIPQASEQVAKSFPRVDGSRRPIVPCNHAERRQSAKSPTFRGRAPPRGSHSRGPE